MKWKKLGHIFNPRNYHLADNYVGYAQSPQAIVFKDYIRVYFSTRTQDRKNKFISHVQYVDFNNDFNQIIRVSKKEVLSKPELGTFDEHGIFPFSPIRVESQIFGYTSGWSRRISVSVETGIGLAISNDDGVTFKRFGVGPILTTSLFEPFLIVDGFVRKYENKFYMFYIFGKKWSEDFISERVYKIGYAISDDGIHWHKKNRQIINDKIDVDECQALPTVIKIDDRYHMCFCYRHIKGFRSEKENAYRFGYAYSDDLIHWIRDDETLGISVSESGWDSQMVCYPHFVQVENKIYLLYNGNEFGKYGFGIAQLEEI